MATSNTVISPRTVGQDVAQKRQQDSLIRDDLFKKAMSEMGMLENPKLNSILNMEDDIKGQTAAKSSGDNNGSGELSLENLASSMKNGVRSRIAEEYGFDQNVDPYEIMQYLLLKGEMKKAGLQTEEEKRAQRIAGMVKGAKTGADLGSLLGQMLPESNETLAAPARGFGVVGRK